MRGSLNSTSQSRHFGRARGREEAAIVWMQYSAVPRFWSTSSPASRPCGCGGAIVQSLPSLWAAFTRSSIHSRTSPPRLSPCDCAPPTASTLSCKVYHPLTSNTLQFGANLSIHAEACGAELDRHLSLDTLFTFSPFEFDFRISGDVGANYKRYDIASVRLSCDLFGPNPWHAKGKAEVSVACLNCTAPSTGAEPATTECRWPK